MAGRYLIQKFSSQMCRSRSLFSVPARAGAPAPEGSIRPPLSSVSGGAIPLVLNNSEIHGCVCGFRTFSGILPRAVGHTSTAARYTSTCSHVATKTNRSTTSMPSIITNRLRPACMDSSGGAKGSFSSTASTQHEISRSAKRAAWAAKWDAQSAAFQAQSAAWEAELKTQTADFDKFVTNQLLMWGFAVSCWIGVTFLVEAKGTCFCNGQSGTRHCSSCCSGQCVLSKS